MNGSNVEVRRMRSGDRKDRSQGSLPALRAGSSTTVDVCDRRLASGRRYGDADSPGGDAEYGKH